MATKPAAYPYDVDLYPFGAQAGDNKFSSITCSACSREPTFPTKEEWPWPEAPMPQTGVHLFKDALSAQEYRLSGLCQQCQDEVFTAEEDES